MTTTPANVDVTSRDFAALRQSMLDFAAERAPEWRGARSGDPNDFGVVLVEAMAYEGDVLSFYIDRLANEAFLATATQRQSILAHAALLDYQPRAGTPAVAAVDITVTTTVSTVTVPAGFKLATKPPSDSTSAQGWVDSPLVFETTAPLVFPASTLVDAGGNVLPQRQTLTVIAVQGTTVDDEVVGTLCGDPNESATLTHAPVLADTVQLRVVERPGDAGQVWFRVRSLLDAGREDNAYVLSMGANGVVTLTFGDGVNGRIPPRGSVLHASYRVGGGSTGNVDAGIITEVLEPDELQYDGAYAPTSIVTTNVQPARGGTEPESLDSIRANAPRARRTGARAVTLEDYETLALTMPGVQIAKAKAVAKVYTHVTLYVAPPGGTMPDARTLNAVVDYTLPRKLAGVTVVAASPTYVPLDISLHIIVDKRFAQASVRAAVIRAMTDVLEFENVGFGEEVSLSSIYTAATKVPGVVNVQITRLARNSGTDVNDVELAENELPLVGDLNFTAEGGLVNSGDPEGYVDPPVPTPAPVVTLLRCDPTSTHVELTWTPGDATTHWEVEVEWRASNDDIAATTIAGPFTFPEAVFDLPRIGAGRAVTLAFRTRAYNGNTGPGLSPWTTTPYTCE